MLILVLITEMSRLWCLDTDALSRRRSRGRISQKVEHHAQRTGTTHGQLHQGMTNTYRKKCSRPITEIQQLLLMSLGWETHVQRLTIINCELYYLLLGTPRSQHCLCLGRIL